VATLTVAISDKALKHLEATELGKLIAAGKVLEDGSREITIEPDTEQKLAATKSRDDVKHHALADRLIVKAQEARTRGEAEARALGVR